MPSGCAIVHLRGTCLSAHCIGNYLGTGLLRQGIVLQFFEVWNLNQFVNFSLINA